MLIDGHNRVVNYLRISVTERCNFRCQYCMPEKPFSWVPKENLLSFEELFEFIKVCIDEGVNKIRITGGEPLVRKNVVYLIEKIGKIEGIEKVCLTTNGVLLPEMAEDLYKAGLRHINISLDTLNPKKYAYITRVNVFGRVLRGIKKAIEIGFNPVKINVVLMKGFNDDEIVDLAKLSFAYPVAVRFIEFMPLNHTQIVYEHAFLSAEEAMQKLKKLGDLEEIPSSPLDGPAKRYKIKGSLGEIGFITALSDHFCHKCNRLRLTPDGQLRPCLFSDLEWDLKTPLRQGADDAKIRAIIEDAIAHKPKAHGYLKFAAHRPMSRIGG